ncbi:hypothetical protein ACOSQ4_010996 [Xanthoceras sorbifolium]
MELEKASVPCSRDILVDATVHGKDYVLAIPIEPFKHRELETTKVKATITASLANEVAKTIEDELIRNKAVKFDLRIQGVMKHQNLYFFHDKDIKGSCKNLKMFLTNHKGGRMLGDCKCQLGFS